MKKNHVAIVEPVKLNAKRASLLSSDLIDLCINLRIYCTDPQQHEIYLFYMIKKGQIICNGDDLYTSVLQKIVSKNLSKRVYNSLYK